MRVYLPQVPVCFFSVSCCSFTQVAHGDSEQKPNLQPYTTGSIIAFLTKFVKQKRAGIPPTSKEVGNFLPEDSGEYKDLVETCQVIENFPARKNGTLS